ncbi:uncharacterized protein [Littorina saxatilis]|uniref:uncharacterized protein n=1 Tax=Littorina saxatilis TaxID=31220 RepID=UPI0038B46FB2
MELDTAERRENRRCHFVLALPNFTTREEILEYKIKDAPERKSLDEVTLLLRGDLFTDDIKKAEGDYDLENVKAWWNKLEDKPVQPDFIKDVIARYIGEFSTPREYSDKSERSLVRNLCDAIRLTGKLVKRLVISKDHKEEEDFAVKRAHVNGPPGSGRTTMLIKKAEHFLKDDTRNNVVVIDMYRGAKGTPIGHEIFISIEEVDSKRVHHTAFDVNEEGATLLGLPLPKQKEHILFVIDEVLPKRYWKDAFELLASRFADSHVWCADGIVTEDQETCLLRCTSVELKHILRIPTSVQCVLYHADWDAERKELYKADTDHQLEVPTNGPSPVSVRHKGHTNAHLKTTECEQCADELADLLKHKMKLVEEDSSAGGASAAPSVPLLCSIAILYSIPAEHYSEVGEGKPDLVETTVEKFNAYRRQIADSRFVKRLRSRGLPIHNVLLGYMDLQNEDRWDDILVSWVDKFQGLERDVVVFLPGDGPSSTKTEPTPRTDSQYMLRSKSPPVVVDLSTPPPKGPTTRATLKAATLESDQQPGPSATASVPMSESPGESLQRKKASSTTARKIPVPGLAKATSVRTEDDVDPLPGDHMEAAKSSGGGAQAPSDDPYGQLRMAKYYWSVKDVQRYTDWDKTNLVFAATRCTAQLILLVP